MINYWLIEINKKTEELNKALSEIASEEKQESEEEGWKLDV